MNNDEKILKAIEALQTDVKDVKQGQKEQGIAITRFEAGQKNTATKDDVTAIKKDMATKDDAERLDNGQMRLESHMFDIDRGIFAVKEIVQLINQTLTRKMPNLERRVENLEENTGTPNPTKH